MMGPNVNTPEFSSKIKALGETYLLYGNQYFLSTNENEAHAIFDKLIVGVGNQELVIVELNNGNLNYWGYSNKDLWQWIKDHIYNQ